MIVMALMMIVAQILLLLAQHGCTRQTLSSQSITYYMIDNRFRKPLLYVILDFPAQPKSFFYLTLHI